jgi:hypothetical protein
MKGPPNGSTDSHPPTEIIHGDGDKENQVIDDAADGLAKGSGSSHSSSASILSRDPDALRRQISKQVLRHKLHKLRHLVIKEAIDPTYLDGLFPDLLRLFDPQHVVYNGGVANVKNWKISCYLEVMEGGVPCTNPHVELLRLFTPLLDTCDDLFLYWYRQQHACNAKNKAMSTCRRLMTFVTRYTPAPGEQALLKHVDGAGKVDGSVVVALPIDRWSAPYQANAFGGGGITFWDGKEQVHDGDNTTAVATTRPREIHYDTRSGDIAFIDRAVWHQADPITKGTRWALVIFYKVE